MLSFLTRKHSDNAIDLLSSKLYNEETFYQALIEDMEKCGSELIIESPFITYRRLAQLLPTLEKLKARKVRIVIVTRDPRNSDNGSEWSNASDAVSKLQHLGVHVIYKENHHRKLAIVDRQVLYEGSLNILSQNNSSEVMRRMCSNQLAWQMIRFTGIDTLI